MKEYLQIEFNDNTAVEYNLDDVKTVSIRKYSRDLIYDNTKGCDKIVE